MRAARARSVAAPDPAARLALAHQLAAVEAARASERPRGKRSAAVRGVRDGSRDARRRHTASAPADDHRAETAAVLPVDVDRATAAELEALPGIGPVLARRIVADRDSLGSFGSMEGLQQVAGVGPALARRLAGSVTFSGARRPPSALPGGPAAASVRPAPRGSRHRRGG